MPAPAPDQPERDDEPKPDPRSRGGAEDDARGESPRGEAPRGGSQAGGSKRGRPATDRPDRAARPNPGGSRGAPGDSGGGRARDQEGEPDADERERPRKPQSRAERVARRHEERRRANREIRDARKTSGGQRSGGASTPASATSGAAGRERPEPRKSSSPAASRGPAGTSPAGRAGRGRERGPVAFGAEVADAAHVPGPSGTPTIAWPSSTAGPGAGPGSGAAVTPGESEGGAWVAPGEAPLVWKGLRLSPFQREAVAAIGSGRDVLVSAPTGAGKTLVAEYAIEDAVRRRRRCIYTAPIKALSNQKYRDFRDDPAIDVGLMTGDVTIHPTAQVLIMTTEILRNAIFDAPEHLSDVEYVVFDEVHYMDDFERGSVWEESLIFAPRNIRFICLSATISNVDELGAWLTEIRGRETVVIKSSRRPVPLTHRFYTAQSGVFDPSELDRVRRREGDRGRHGGGHDGHGRRGGRGRHGEGRRPHGRELAEPPDAGGLLDELQHRDLLPALVFAFSRKDCERLAWRNARRELLDAVEVERMKALQEELIALFQLDRGLLDGELMGMARRGLAYHHAGMLPIHKELVERMFTSGLLKLLFTTETFALGINMPARSVVFNSLRKFDGVTFDYLSTRDYLQMAGRAGRQGIDEEGLVFSLLSQKDLNEAPVQRLLSARPEPVESRFRLSYSSILHLIERLGRERLIEAWEKSFNQFQHRAGTKKQQDHNRREQRRILDAHVALLEDLGYLHGRGRGADETVPPPAGPRRGVEAEGERAGASRALTPRGRVAKMINGYELQVTELCFGGELENLPADALAIVFVGLVYEERRRGEIPWVPAKLFGNVRTAAQRGVHAILARAAEHGLSDTIKMPDWGLTAATQAWLSGASFEGVMEHTDATPGDVVRTFRMAVQLMRQVRRAIDTSWDLHERLGRAMEALNHDVVDARRQLELG